MVSRAYFAFIQVTVYDKSNYCIVDIENNFNVKHTNPSWIIGWWDCLSFTECEQWLCNDYFYNMNFKV